MIKALHRPPGGHLARVVRLAACAALAWGILTDSARGWAQHYPPTPPQPGKPYVPGRILVKARAGLTAGAVEERLRRQGLRAINRAGRLGWARAELSEPETEGVLARLRSDPAIEFVEREGLGRAAFEPADPGESLTQEWHLEKIGAPQAWALASGRPTTIVAVLDSGINAAHPDLAGRVLPGHDFIEGDDDPADDFGHGTAVAGVVAAAGENGFGVAGVAHGCVLLPVKVADANGFAPYSAIAEGIRYAVDHGARVINISIAGDLPSQVLQEAIDYAWANNVLVVAAAGNTANDFPQYPAACTNVVAVSATRADDTLAGFSSFGPHVRLGAPGENIWTTQRDPSRPYGAWRGTSFASPVVAGVAALLMSRDNALSNSDLTDLLQRNADDIGAAGWDPGFGFGRVNAARSVAAAGGSAPSAGVSVAITSPGPGIQPLRERCRIVAEASCDQGAISSVEFFDNGASLGAAVSPPWTVDWVPGSASRHALVALVYVEGRFAGMSSPVVVQGAVADEQRPALSIWSAPENGARLGAAAVSLAGTARDNLAVSRVELRVNDGPPQIARGTTNWIAEAILAAGPNEVRVRAVDEAGNTSIEAVRRWTLVVHSPLKLAVEGQGKVVPDLNGRSLEIGRRFCVTAVPGAGQAFAGWKDTGSGSPVRAFTMASNLALTAVFVPNPFPPVRGAYAGLVAGTNGVDPAACGSFRLNVTSSGGFTGQLTRGGRRQSFSGKFDLNGEAVVALRQSRAPALSLSLRLDLGGGSDSLAGWVVEPGGGAELTGHRNVFHPRTNPAPQAGWGRFCLEDRDEQGVQPAATARSRVSPGGAARVWGRFNDGRAFAAGGSVSKAGEFPFYYSRQAGVEGVIGWIDFAPAWESGPGGALWWVRSGTNGFATELQVKRVP